MIDGGSIEKNPRIWVMANKSAQKAIPGGSKKKIIAALIDFGFFLSVSFMTRLGCCVVEFYEDIICTKINLIEILR